MIFQGYGHCLRLALLGFLSVWSNVLFCQGFEGRFSALQFEYECASQEVKMQESGSLTQKEKMRVAILVFGRGLFGIFQGAKQWGPRFQRVHRTSWWTTGKFEVGNTQKTWCHQVVRAPCWFVKPRWFFFCHNWNTSCKCSGRNGLKMLM